MLEPRNANALHNRASAHEKLGNNAEALADYAAIALDRANASSFNSGAGA